MLRRVHLVCTNKHLFISVSVNKQNKNLLVLNFSGDNCLRSINHLGSFSTVQLSRCQNLFLWGLVTVQKCTKEEMRRQLELICLEQC